MRALYLGIGKSGGNDKIFSLDIFDERMVGIKLPWWTCERTALYGKFASYYFPVARILYNRFPYFSESGGVWVPHAGGGKTFAGLKMEIKPGHR